MVVALFFLLLSYGQQELFKPWSFDKNNWKRINKVLMLLYFSKEKLIKLNSQIFNYCVKSSVVRNGKGGKLCRRKNAQYFSSSGRKRKQKIRKQKMITYVLHLMGLQGSPSRQRTECTKMFGMVYLSFGWKNIYIVDLVKSLFGLAEKSPPPLNVLRITKV